MDDGSPDDTFAVARAAFGTHPDVSIVRKPNGGKASALNVGIAHATMALGAWDRAAAAVQRAMQLNPDAPEVKRAEERLRTRK